MSLRITALRPTPTRHHAPLTPSMADKLEFEVSYVAGVITAKAEGILGFLTTPDLKRKMAAWIEPGVKQINLDLAGLGPIDSAGIAAILQAIKMCNEKEIVFRLRNSPPTITAVLNKSKLTAVLNEP